MWSHCVAMLAKNNGSFTLPEFKLSKKAIKMSQCILHTVRVQVEVSQGLISGDVTYLLQASGKVLSQGPHCYTLYLPVHDNGACSQTLHRNTNVINYLPCRILNPENCVDRKHPNFKNE